MADGNERGPQVPDTEDALRAILYPWQWANKQDRPSSAAFDDEVFSVDIASRTTPERTARRFRDAIRVVQFNCGSARQHGFDTRDEPDPLHPDNHAHANVYFEGYHELPEKKRKARARKLSELCLVVYASGE